ncbi:hypothetical protein [Zhongshania aquimaris]|uniref:Uncharacterized protein n=1 Tax=Zhongshania aquimaris TaxID=2857107 RepID=A0ABS6VRE0_9GAMM|nr:hypothetical protein [Zhongshania aquimaris]MBW2940887.1 hypothetical protein [Zhongshania aquimaris]
MSKANAFSVGRPTSPRYIVECYKTRGLWILNQVEDDDGGALRVTTVVR